MTMNLLQDIRYGARMLASKPGVTAAAVLSLALGVGANSAVFSLIDALMLKGLPGVDAPRELVILGAGRSRGINESNEPVAGIFSHPRFLGLRDGTKTLSSLAAVNSMDVTVYIRRGAEERPTAGEARLVSGEYFSTLGVRPVYGRLLGPDDDRTTSGHPVAVLDYGYWRKVFGGDESALGASIVLNDKPFTVVGVTPQDFSGERLGERPDLYLSVRMQPEARRESSFLERPEVSFLQLIGRLAPGVGIEDAQAELATIWHRILEAEGGEQPSEAWLRAKDEAVLTLRSGANGYSGTGDVGNALWLLLGVTALVLLIACANVANLMLARGASRRRELGVRLALGADRRRLFAQMLTESVMLAALAGVAALLFAAWSRDALVTMAGATVEDLGLSSSLDPRVAAFTAAAALGTGMLFGLAPSWRAGRTDIASVMRSARGAAGGGGKRLQAALVIGQAALSLLLLFGAGLFLESLSKLAKADVGIAKDSLLSIEIDPQGGGLELAGQTSLGRRLVEAVGAVPGVESAAMAYRAPATSGNHTIGPTIRGYQPAPNEDVLARLFLVSPGYFETVGTPLLAGRSFGPEDAEGATPFAIVDQTFVERYFGQKDPLEQAVQFDSQAGMVPVVGVVAAARLNAVREELRPTVYVSGYAYPDFWRAMAVRVTGEPTAVAAAVRAAIAEVEPRLPIQRIATVEARLADQAAADRMLQRLVSAFGILALLLAAVGLYGVLSYRVAGRTSEIGVRMAVGAKREDLLRLIIKEGLVLAGIGIALGAMAAPFAATAARALLFQTEPWNATALGVAAVVLLTVTCAASLAPSLRAARLDPVHALREE